MEFTISPIPSGNILNRTKWSRISEALVANIGSALELKGMGVAQRRSLHSSMSSRFSHDGYVVRTSGGSVDTAPFLIWLEKKQDA